MKASARRLTKIERAAQPPARYVVLHERDFDNVEALDAEAHRLQTESDSKVTIIKVVYAADWNQL